MSRTEGAILLALILAIAVLGIFLAEWMRRRS